MRGGVIVRRADPAPVASRGVPSPRIAAGPWMALALGVGACVAIALLAAPDQIDQTRVQVSGGSDAVASLQAAIARHVSDAAISIDSAADAVTIGIRHGSSLIAGAPVAGSLLASQAIAELAAARVPAPPAPATPNPAATLLTVQRAGLQSELSDADHDAATLNTAYSDTIRDIANLQREDAIPATDPAADPIRALLAQVQMRRIDLAARYTADFPGIAIADSEIARLQELAQQQRPRQPSSKAALATLRAEQIRLQTALDAATARHTSLAGQIAQLDASLAAALTPPPALPALPVPTYQIEDAGSFVFPDPRPWLYAGAMTLALVLASWLGRRRRPAVRADSFAQHISAIEHATRLPVLRCLDTHGRPLTLDPRPTPTRRAVLALER